MMSDLNMPQGKMSDFASFSLFRFILLMKLRIFDFEKSLKYFNGLLIKKVWCQI